MSKNGTLLFEPDIRISVTPLVASGAILLIILSMAAEAVLPSAIRIQTMLLLCAAVTCTWLLDNWHSRVSRWFLLSAMTLTVCALYLATGFAGLLALLALPVALAAPLINLRAAALSAFAATAAMLILAGQAGHAPDVGVALIAVWGVLGIMICVYNPVYELLHWTRDYYQQAQGLVEESRTRRGELRQALDELTHANQQLALVNERLALARMVAEEAEKKKTAFVANVSHEFRTPLNMIIGLIDIVMEDPGAYGHDLPPALLEDLDIVHRNCEHLSGMINDVLDLSQIEAGRLALRKERVDLGDVIQQAVAVVEPLLHKKDLGLTLEIEDALPEMYCDRTRVGQVVVNLLSNAARFTDHGGITVRAKQAAQYVEVRIADTGPGISEQDAKRVFEPFYQGRHERQTQQRGSGLGLSISKQFIELHGGRMHLDTQLGVGSTFSFSLPILPLPDTTTDVRRWLREDWTWHERTGASPAPVEPPKQRVVICDPGGDLVRLFERYSQDVEFVEAENLTGALQNLQRSAAQALVLNMASLPMLYASVERARLSLPDIPIIGCSLPARAEHAIRAGASAYLLKPVTRARLEQVIQQSGAPVRRVLIVDDDVDTQQLFRRMLSACDPDIEVTAASSGTQALEELRRQPPDLVLLDVILPDLDGWQLLAIKQQDPSIRDVPVAMVSAQDPSERPVETPVLVAAIGDGLSISKLFGCIQTLTQILPVPD